MKALKKRWFVLTSNFLYMFKKEFDEHPSRIIFIEGCYIEYELVDEDAKNGYFGFEIIRGDDIPSQNKTFLYTKSVEERQQWVSDLRKSAKTVPITDLYDVGEQIGKGKFSVVHVGFEKSTGDKYAIKVLEKKKIDEGEKESLRQEIAILNVVRHPRIVQMKEVFENPEKIFIILRLYENGDLFKYIRNLKTRLSELSVKKIIWNLIDTVMYLHSLGIVHRDLSKFILKKIR
jgi:serine/threonine protein kinase